MPANVDSSVDISAAGAGGPSDEAALEEAFLEAGLAMFVPQIIKNTFKIKEAAKEE